MRLSNRNIAQLGAYAVALPPLAALALVRMWAVLGGHLPGKLLAPTALLLAVAGLFVVWRFDLPARFLLPWPGIWRNACAAGISFALGAYFDTSYAMFSADGLLVGAGWMRLLCHMGSGIFCAAIVLALLKAARDFGPAGKIDMRIFLVIALGLNVLAALYVSGSALVYTWDNAGYWTVAQNLARAPLSLAQMREVLETVIHYDYNYLLAFPISLVMRLLGDSRYVFILSIVNLYLLPAVWGLCVLARRKPYGGLLLTLALPMLSYIALVGFVDVAAAAVGIWAFVIYTDFERADTARGILTGAMLVGTFLLRRYFFFFAVSFGISILLEILLLNREKWRAFLATLCSAGTCAVFFTQSFLVEKVLSVRYGDIYSAYNLGLKTDFFLLFRYFGVIILLFALFFAVYLGFFAPKGCTFGCNVALIALTQIILCFFLLTRVQSHGAQHLLLYLPAIATLFAKGTAALPDRKPLSSIVAVVAACAALSTTLPRVQPTTATDIKTAAPMPSFTFAAVQRGDIPALIALRAYVDGLSAEVPKSAAIVSSSFTFNGETYTNLLRSIGLPEPTGAKTAMIYMATVDKRDWFSWNVLTADYLLVGDPVQVHLGEENQQIMALLARDVLDGTGLGTAYRAHEISFTLDDGVTVRIYERTRPLTDAEYRSISTRLTALYPDYAAQYASPR